EDRLEYGRSVRSGVQVLCAAEQGVDLALHLVRMSSGATSSEHGQGPPNAHFGHFLVAGGRLVLQIIREVLAGFCPASLVQRPACRLEILIRVRSTGVVVSDVLLIVDRCL